MRDGGGGGAEQQGTRRPAAAAHLDDLATTVLYREIETVFGLERIPVLFVQIKSVQNDCYIYRYKVSSPLNILIFTIWNAAFTGAFKCSLIYTDILIYKQRLFVYVRMCLS